MFIESSADQKTQVRPSNNLFPIKDHPNQHTLRTEADLFATWVY